MAGLYRWKPDLAEKLKGESVRFSGENAFQVLLASIDMKAFRKSAMPSPNKTLRYLHFDVDRSNYIQIRADLISGAEEAVLHPR